MVAAKDRIRVNCDLRHVTVVLCCDPKAFTHTNPLDGIKKGGSLVWESDAEGERAWENLPLWARKQIIDKNIRVFTLPGFDIARKATDRGDLQLRMQGNAFLGAFFACRPCCRSSASPQEQFREVVHKQYVKKFGKLGEAVVKSNMEVMTAGLRARARKSRSANSPQPIAPRCADSRCCRSSRWRPSAAIADRRLRLPAAAHPPARRPGRAPAVRRPSTTFDAEFRASLGYHQPADALAAVGVMAAGTGDTASKYVARRETPLYIAENCTQCMECISVCPDTALPNTSQDLEHRPQHRGHQLRHRSRRARAR